MITSGSISPFGGSIRVHDSDIEMVEAFNQSIDREALDVIRDQHERNMNIALLGRPTTHIPREQQLLLLEV